MDIVTYAVKLKSTKYKPTQSVGRAIVVEFMYHDEKTAESVLEEILPLTGLHYVPIVRRINGWYVLEVMLPITLLAGISGREFSTKIAVEQSRKNFKLQAGII